MPQKPKTPPPPGQTSPPVTADAALSFLKDTKGALTWSARDLADTLNISRRDADQVIAFLEAQGYAKRHAHDDAWITTPAGTSVSGAKQPRFAPEHVRQALDALAARIQDVNKNAAVPFSITNAVAFGDFLLPDRARVQAADVGIALSRRGNQATREARNEGVRREDNATHEAGAKHPKPHSATEAREERKFLRDLRAKSTMLNLRPYAGWMTLRTHRVLL